MQFSRFMAHQLRRQLVRKRGMSILNRSMKREIKAYARERFGSASYWPYLALYSEVRGQFIPGWIPYDYYRYVWLGRVNPQSSCDISEQKTFDHKIFGDFVLKPLFVFISGKYMTADFEVVDESVVMNFLKNYNDDIVLKEELGTKGKQVYFMHSSEFDPEGIRKNTNYLIQPRVKQYKALNELYPDSVNTLRVNTYLRPDGEVEVKFVVLRFGVNGLKIDNISSGGQFIYFDDQGIPSSSAYDTFGYNYGPKHINSGYLFSDLRLPMFSKAMEKCKEAHRKYPYVRLIGWDVCIQDSGEPKLLEWNADNPGFWYWEAVIGPFWPGNSDFEI